MKFSKYLALLLLVLFFASTISNAIIISHVRGGNQNIVAARGFSDSSTATFTPANPQAAQTNEQPKLPDTPAAKRLAEVLAAIETDDGAKVRAFIKTFSKAFLDEIPEAEHLDFFEQVHERQGGFDVVRIEKSTPYSIIAIVRGKKTGDLRKIVVDVESIAPNAVARLGFGPADGAPAPGGQPGAGSNQAIRLLDADEMNRKLDDFLTRLSSYGFSGSALVAKGDTPLFNKAYGLADRSRNIQNTPDTLFDIGSVSKQFTSAAILKLEMMGKLNTSDPLTKFFDNVPDDKKGITVLQMLSMTSGLVPTPGPDGSDAMRDRDKRVRQILDSPLSFAPGTRYQYSNSGYNIAAAIVEKVSGQPFDQFLYEQLLKPAGMTNTGFKTSTFRVPDWDKKTVVRLYNGDEDNGSAGDKDEAAWFLNGPGGILTTTGDLLKWHLALLGDKILSAQAKQKLYTPVMNDYALGWRVTTTPFGKLIVHNGGTSLGAGAHFMRFVDRGVTIIFCVNNAGEDFNEPVSDALTRLVFGEEAPMPPLVVSLPASAVARFTGTYKTESGGSFEVTAARNGIKLSANDPAGLRALYGASDRQIERYKMFEARTLAIVQGSMKGEYSTLHEAFGRRMPIERLAAMEKRMLDNQAARFGSYKSFAIIGSTPESQGDVGVVVRFDFEKGSFYRQYTWVPRGLDGVRPLSGPPSLIFVPVSPTEFGSYDITSGDIARVKFEVSAAGEPSALVIERRFIGMHAMKEK
jgi:CubicO group peptidase (beta-lactamase class C family)